MVEPRNFSEFDEDDVRSRPARSTRPRTKDRPDYSKAATAFVVAVDRGRVTCLLESATELTNGLITAMKSREIGKSSVVVGDTVGIVGDITGDEGSLARIVTVAERRNALTRTVDDDAELEQMLIKWQLLLHQKIQSRVMASLIEHLLLLMTKQSRQ